METIEKKLRLKIWHDSFAANPFLEWDCEPAVMANYGRNNFSDFSKGEIETFIKNNLNQDKVVEEKDELADIVGYNLEWFDGTDEELYDELTHEIDYSDVEQLTKVLELFSLPHLNYTSRGYSQGDWADVLIVATDEFFQRTGANRELIEEILEDTKNLFDSWAWGDVFGITIEEGTTIQVVEKETQKVLREEIDWEQIDSCGGFYGEDFENNGMMDHVPDELKEELKSFDKSNIEY